ncbi:uncharacterized protein LOC121760476 [Salvia splendens]|uniref:uncharacterized protein LOC121760476 n=1 Tax=Salvia splendens TaxID=180675 RepID=UPI001C280EED|nr:uncharacterized protein LOC121760476 [Salvia splendens]
MFPETVSPSRKDWSKRLDNTLWAYQTAYKTPIERKLQLQVLEELLLESYDAAMWYKEKTKLWHDKYLRVKELQVGQKALLFQSRLKLMPGKLKSKSIRPYTIVALRANGAVEFQGSDPSSPYFLVNGHRVKPFRDNSKICSVEEISLRIPGIFA